MKKWIKITQIETKLFFREPASWLVALVMPTLVLALLGALPNFRTPQAVFGGQRFIDLFVPSLTVLTVATLGINALPVRLAGYREKGILRRLFTTPVHPGAILLAQLVIQIVLAVAAVVLLIFFGRVVFDVPLPQNGAGFALAFGLGLSSVFALGLLIAAAAPTTRTASAVSMPAYFLIMLLGGTYLPRMFLPEFLVRIGAFTPPGIQALFDTWMGASPDGLQLAVLAATTLISFGLAGKLFRWDHLKQ